MASSECEISLVEDRHIVERKLTVVRGPNVVIGRRTFIPTTIIAMWTRLPDAEWTLLSLTVQGHLVKRDEDGRPEVHPEIMEEHRYEQVAWAPSWIRSAAKTYRPSATGKGAPAAPMANALEQLRAKYAPGQS